MNQGDLVEAVLAAIRAGLSRGEKVAVSGFGSFEAMKREARQGRNPQTGEEVATAASTAVPPARLVSYDRGGTRSEIELSHG